MILAIGPQFGRCSWVRELEVRHQVLGRGQQDGGAGDVGMAHERSLDLGQVGPSAADLVLAIQPAAEAQAAIGQAHAAISSPVHPVQVSRVQAVLAEALVLALGRAAIAPGHLNATDHKLAFDADRTDPATLIQHKDVVARQGLADARCSHPWVKIV